MIRDWLVALALIAAATAPALAEEPTETAASGSPGWALSLELRGGGPLYFGDTHDATLEPTTVFARGAAIGYLYGDELARAHRFGLALGYDWIARSDTRRLSLLVPEFRYQTGRSLQLTLGLGWAAAIGTADFAKNYQGPSGSVALGWSFRDAHSPSALGVMVALVARVVLSTQETRYSSAFLGAEVTFAFHGGR